MVGMKKVISLFICVIMVFQTVVSAQGTALNTTAKSVLLMEADTGEILYENNADEQLPIASVTKIMTLLLIFEAIADGKITMDDIVPVSQRAMSMGGSTMFLAEGEQLSVGELIKGIAVASANDGCVAMAEYLSGSVEGFVDEMNKKANELGMTNTNFINTNGLDEDGHYSSARDVAIMSRALIAHTKIFEFTTIWTDKMNNGQYDLSNTNKLIRFYEGANGLKTGSTSKAGCCISATAKRNDMQLIAVVLGASNSDERFADARTLLDYGFANYKIEKVTSAGDVVTNIPVKKGVYENVDICAKDSFSILLKKGDSDKIETKTYIPPFLNAPIQKEQAVGNMTFILDGKEIGEIELVSGGEVEKKSFLLVLLEMFSKMIG